MVEPFETTEDLVYVLRQYRQEIAKVWLLVIQRQMADAVYTRRPPEEILTNNLEVADTILDFLLSTEKEITSSTNDVSLDKRNYVLGLSIGEVVEALFLFEEAVRPFVHRTWPEQEMRADRVLAVFRAVVRSYAKTAVVAYQDLSNQHLREQRERTSIMLDAARLASQTLDLDCVLRDVARGIAAATEAPYCLLFLGREDEHPGVFWSRTGSYPALPPDFSSPVQPFYHATLALIQQVVDSQKPVICNDAHTDPWLSNEAAHMLGIKSALGVPCAIGERILAVALAITTDDYREFTEGQIELACGVANVVAPAIENARLYRRVEALAALAERTRLAREIHDDLAQTVGALQLKSSLASLLLQNGQYTQAQAQLAELQAIADDAYTAVREAIFDLRAIVSLESGFIVLLQEFLADYRQHYQVEVHLDADEAAAAALTGNTAVQAIRIIQEALTNARRHGRASQVWIHVAHLDHVVRIIVKDNGQGFDPLQIPGPGRLHFGLHVMRERAETAGGRLKVVSQPGQGSRVMLEFPYRRDRDQL